MLVTSITEDASALYTDIVWQLEEIKTANALLAEDAKEAEEKARKMEQEAKQRREEAEKCGARIAELEKVLQKMSKTVQGMDKAAKEALGSGRQ